MMLPGSCHPLNCQCVFCIQYRLGMGRCEAPAPRPCEHCYCIKIPANIDCFTPPHVKCCNCGHQRVKGP